MKSQHLAIATICRLNQARSIISSATIRNIFPDIEVSSAGIAAQSARAIPKGTEVVCNKWNLPDFDRYSKSINDLLDGSPIDSFLAADLQVANELNKYIERKKISLISDFVDDENLIPIDPVGLSPLRYEKELAKVANASIRWAEKALNNGLSNLDSVIYLNKSQNPINVEVDNLNQSGSDIYIDGDIKIPNDQYWLNQGFDVRYFNPRDLSNFSIFPNKSGQPIVLVSKFEVDNPGSIFLSKNWRDFLIKLQNDANLRIVVGITNLQTLLSAEQILAMAHSSKTEISYI